MKCETNPNNCPIEVTLSLIGGKYKPVILWFLIDHVRFQVSNRFLFPFDCLGIELNQVILQGVPLAFMVGF